MKADLAKGTETEETHIAFIHLDMCAIVEHHPSIGAVQDALNHLHVCIIVNKHTAFLAVLQACVLNRAPAATSHVVSRTHHTRHIPLIWCNTSELVQHGNLMLKCVVVGVRGVGMNAHAWKGRGAGPEVHDNSSGLRGNLTIGRPS